MKKILLILIIIAEITMMGCGRNKKKIKKDLMEMYEVTGYKEVNGLGTFSDIDKKTGINYAEIVEHFARLSYEDVNVGKNEYTVSNFLFERTFGGDGLYIYKRGMPDHIFEYISERNTFKLGPKEYGALVTFFAIHPKYVEPKNRDRSNEETARVVAENIYDVETFSHKFPDLSILTVDVEEDIFKNSLRAYEKCKKAAKKCIKRLPKYKKKFNLE